ncbi:MAG: D-alanyl-D-alanine carboxypeptidase family protein [Blastocatellales bacterium]
MEAADAPNSSSSMNADGSANVGGSASSGNDAGSTKVPKNAKSSVAFAAAVEQNTKLRFDLNWTFGGKSQRGWHLYVPLIRQFLNTDSGPESRDFSQALAGWQKSAGLSPTGVLDQKTWMTMVSVFQSRRIKDRIAPTSEQLTLVPASEFYDSERPESLRYVHSKAYAAYKKLAAAATAELALNPDSSEKWLTIISAYRSPAYQAQLRKRNPKSGRAGLALNSPHSTGRALDLHVGGEPVSTNDRNRAIQVNTKVYQWLVKNAERFGFYPYFYEPWHWEYRPRRPAER